MIESGMRPKLLRLLASFIACLSLSPALSASPQDPAKLTPPIEAFLQSHLRSLPGKASYTLAPVPFSQSRPQCEQPLVALAPSARPYGKTTLQITCHQPAWQLYLPVTIEVRLTYLVAAHPLMQGQQVAQSDIATQEGLLHELPQGTFTTPSEVIGLMVGSPIQAGQALREPLLRRPNVVQAGQSVKVILRGAGFEVANEGRALQSAAAGKTVQVRLANGQTLLGTANNEGVIEVGR